MSSMPTGTIPREVRSLISSWRLFSQFMMKGVFLILKGRPCGGNFGE
jgi:hypothetical protein